jgi:hypothetical protein
MVVERGLSVDGTAVNEGVGATTLVRVYAVQSLVRVV